MPRDFFPRRDADVLVWSRAFLHGIESHESHFGLSETDVALFAQKQESFATRYRETLDPSTRTTPVVAGKNSARRELEIVARQFSLRVKSFEGSTDADRAELGIASPNPARRRHRPVPASAPIVKVLSIKGHLVTLRLGNAESITSRARAPGAVAADIFTFVGEHPPTTLPSWRYQLGTPKVVTTIQLDPTLPNGSRIWITARWRNARSEPGPFSDPVSVQTSEQSSVGNFAMSRAA